METIDLSKAKIGDKFRTKGGQILEYIGSNIDSYKLMDENNSVFYYHEKGNFLSLRESDHDLIVQVFDKPLDELIKEATKQIKENDDAIAEENAEENELQRRKDVVELAEKIWLKNGWYYDAFTDAETFIELKTKYLKEGKLC